MTEVSHIQTSPLIFSANQCTGFYITGTSLVKELTLCNNYLNDTHRERLGFTQFSTGMAGWLLLIFLICLHNQLSSIYSIISTDV